MRARAAVAHHARGPQGGGAALTLAPALPLALALAPNPTPTLAPNPNPQLKAEEQLSLHRLLSFALSLCCHTPLQLRHNAALDQHSGPTPEAVRAAAAQIAARPEPAAARAAVPPQGVTGGGRAMAVAAVAVAVAP